MNYRAIGRGTGGVIKKRTPIFIKDLDPATPSSVPTKYQTVLYPHNHENKGFARNSPRFEVARLEAVPGPGSYAGDEPLDPAPEPARGKGVDGSKCCLRLRLLRAFKGHEGR